jgi:acetoin:2,6-dichlorophenolindophenol oxidoreductase subunit alpha
MDDLSLYRAMYRIRRFEETVLDNFARGVFSGTTHTCLGQEANAVGVLGAMQPDDVVFSNHRCHGHFLAYGGDLQALFAELMGKPDGVCAGRGGSQHLHWRNFYSNGIQGGIIPTAVGMALAEKRKSTGVVVTAFMGDGTLGEGVVYEALNMASLWGAPVLFVLENNRIAQTTPIELVVAGDISARFSAFGIPALELDTSDVRQILPVSNQILSEIRSGAGPRALIIHTCRFGPHSKGDDTRPTDEVARMRQERDPLEIHGHRLDEAQRSGIEKEVDAEVSLAFQQALSGPQADLASLGQIIR